jgi:hypothetical protein
MIPDEPGVFLTGTSRNGLSLNLSRQRRRDHERREPERLIRIIFRLVELSFHQHESTFPLEPLTKDDTKAIETSVYTLRTSRIVSTPTNTLESQQKNPSI